MSVPSIRKKRNIVLAILLAIFVVLAVKLVIFELFKTCGDCGNLGNRNVAANTVWLDDSDNGKTFVLFQGWKATVVLDSTHWTFQPIAETNVVRQIGDSVSAAVPLDKTIPGSGVGTMTAKFQLVAPGTAVIKATRTTCGEALPCLPDQQNFAVTITVVTSLTDNDYRNYALVYSSSNGSLPPPYHQERVMTVSEDAAGTIRATYEIKDYTKVLKTSDLSVTSDQFISLMTAGLAVSLEQSDALAGCAGGSSKSVMISQNGKPILESGAYSCAGETSNASFEKFANEAEDLLTSYNNIE